MYIFIQQCPDDMVSLWEDTIYNFINQKDIQRIVKSLLYRL